MSGHRASIEMPNHVETPTMSPSTSFFKTMQRIAQRRAPDNDSATASVTRSTARVHYFATAGRTVWTWFEVVKRGSMMQGWRQQALADGVSEESKKILLGFLARLANITGEDLLHTEFNSKWTDEQNYHIKHQMFGMLVQQARSGARGFIPLCAEWQDAILRVMYDYGGLAGDTFEVFCLARLLFPNFRPRFPSSSVWGAFLDALEEQLCVDGYTMTNTEQAGPTNDHPMQIGEAPGLNHSFQHSSASPEQSGGQGLGLPATHVIDQSFNVSSATILSSNSHQMPASAAMTDSRKTSMDSDARPQPPTPAPKSTSQPTTATTVAGSPSRPQDSLQKGVEAFLGRFNTRTAKLEVKSPTATQELEVADVRASFDSWQQKLSIAIASPPINANTKEAAAAKAFFKKVDKLDETPEDCAFATASALLDAVINLHQDGTLLREEELRGFWVQFHHFTQAADRSYGIKDRLNKIIDALRQNKLIAADCTFNERSIEFLAWGPGMLMARKGQWAKLNANKARKAQVLVAKAAANSSSGIASAHQTDGEGDGGGDEDEEAGGDEEDGEDGEH